jgi:glycosyltransferase involved in cell wall biosynthesis
MALTLCREWLSQGMRPIVVVLFALPTDLAPEFAALGIQVILLDMPKTGLLRYAKLGAKFFLLAHRHHPEALLSMPLGWHTFMAIGARLAGVRRVAAHVGNYPDPTRGSPFRKFRVLVQLGRPFTDTLVCCSRYVQHGAIKNFALKSRETVVVYNGVPAHEFESHATTQPQSLQPDRPFTIGMVARLEKHKDHTTLIRAAKILKTRGRNIVVQIVGDGSQRSALQKQIDADDLGDTVLLLGMRRDVANILANFDLFVFSTTPDEGFGIALVEAMLAGVPILASDVGACREVLDNGSLGNLFPAGDAVALADAIEGVCAKPSEVKNRTHRAREKAAREFSAIAMARRYAEVLGLPAGTQLQAFADMAPELLA